MNVRETLKEKNQLVNITLGDLLDLMAEEYPENDAVVYTDRPFRKTYAAFRDHCNLVAKGMLAMGIQKGDHVAVWATNLPEWITAMFATAKIGAVLVTVNTNYKVFEMEYLLKQSDAGTLILMEGFKDCNYVDIVNELCPELKDAAPGQLCSEAFPFLKNLVYINGKGDVSETGADIDAERKPGMYHWEDLYEMAKTVSDAQLDAVQKSLNPHDVINMQYTSGTTGFPKGVMLTHYNILNNGKSIGDCMNFSYQDRLCVTVPFFHCFGCVLAIMASVTHGTTMVPVEVFSPLKVMGSIQEEKCTAVHGVPTMFIAMLEHEQFKTFDFSTLRTGIMAGSPCPVKVMQQVVDQMNMREITIVFGQTESSPGCTQTTVEDSLELRVNTVGRTLPFIEAKVIDAETGKEQPCGVPGEFIARGYNIMKGYYKMEEATKAAIDEDGWLHTGDIATMDENGYFKITGRMKDMIIRGGENIYPKEIEEFLYTHPAIKDVQVVGAPSKDYGEEVGACIILKEGITVTEEEVKTFVKGNMARYKTPRHVLFIDHFPMTASGKIQKYILKEMIIEAFHLEDAANIETA